jgi:HK97 family phage prohead protease
MFDVMRRITEVAEVRADTDSGHRVIRGRLVPYGERALIGIGVTESIAPGCFTKSISERSKRLPLMAAHNHESFPIGSADSWDDESDGLYGTWRIANTTQADEAYGLVCDGHLSSLSVGFQPVPGKTTVERGTPPEPDHLIRREARLLEASLVAVPAYEGAGITAVRAMWRPVGTPRLDEARRILADIKSNRVDFNVSRPGR